MSYLIRRAERRDVPLLAELLKSYMQETYRGVWGGSAEQLEKDVFVRKFETLLAQNPRQEIIGFIGWIWTYDLHYCMSGGQVIDFYVSPPFRGRGAGLLLAVELAAEIKKQNGEFLQGGAVENPIVRRFYERIAMSFSNGECYLSGRAFRHFAELSGKSLRKIVRNLPDPAWNREP